MTVHKALPWAELLVTVGATFVLLALGVCSLLLSSCGGNGTPSTVDTGTPSPVISVIFEVDGTLPDAEVAEAMEELEEVIQKRAEGFGAEVVDVNQREANQLALEVSGVTLDKADELFARTALVDIREPERDEAGDIVCENTAGQTFTVPGDTVPDGTGDPRAAYVVTDHSGDLTQCQGPNDAAPRGSVVWRAATGVGNDGVEKPLTGRSLEPNSEVIFDQLGRPLVRIRFDTEGASLFDQITARLVGFPLAIRLDGEIISAPTIRTRISDGSAAVGGLTEDEARTLAVQLNSGPLPDSARVLAVGERSQP